MIKYEYEFADFALSDKSIHLLRNKYNYKTITYHDLEKALITRGSETKNPILSLVIGVALLSFSVLKCISLYGNFNDPSVHIIYIESILLPLFPALIGAYLVYVSTKKGLILQVEEGSVRHKLRLKEIQKNKQSESMKQFLREKLSYKLVIDGSV